MAVSLTEGHRVKAFDNKVQRSKFVVGGRSYVTRSFMICRILFNKYLYREGIKKDELGGTCSVHGNDKLIL